MKSLTLFFTFTLATVLLPQPSNANEVYIQAGKGSFNHAAFDLLPEQENYQRHYSGTPSNTYAQAVKHGTWAFSAIENSTIEGHLVPAIVEAMRDYQITELKTAVRMPIEMCVFAKEKDQKITQAASHPAALKQISQWLNGNNIAPIPEPKGTNEAARLLATNQLKPGTVAVGSCALKKVYPQLELVDKGIQNNADNRTLFALMHMAKRKQRISTEQARIELTSVVKNANMLIQARQKSAEELFTLINNRLRHMKAVALFKAQQHRAVEDLERENLVLKKSLNSAKQQCLDATSVSEFFQAQMDAAKAIQYRYRAQWLSEGTAKQSTDLDSLRQSLNSLGTKIVEGLSSHLSNHGRLGQELFQKFHWQLDIRHLSKNDKQRLFSSLINVQKDSKCR